MLPEGSAPRWPGEVQLAWLRLVEAWEFLNVCRGGSHVDNVCFSGEEEMDCQLLGITCLSPLTTGLSLKLYIYACSLFINQTGTSWLPTSSYSLALDWPSPSLPWDTSCWRSRSLRGGFTQCIASSPLRCQSLFVRSSEKIYLEILMLLETLPCLDNWLDLLTWICGQQILRQWFLFFVCGKYYE